MSESAAPPASSSRSGAATSASRSGRSRSRRRKKSSSGVWGKIFLWTAALVPVLALAGYLGFKIWLNNFLHSDSFRVMLDDKASALLDAKAEFHELSWEDRTLHFRQFTAQGSKKAPFSRLTADDIRAEVDLKLWDRTIAVPAVSIGRITAVLSEDGRLPDVPPVLAEALASAGQDSGGFFSSLKPNKVDFREIRLDDVQMVMKGRDGEIRLAGMPVMIRAGESGGPWQMQSNCDSERAVLTSNIGTGFRLGISSLNARISPSQFNLIELAGELRPLQPRTDGPRTDDLTKTRVTVNGGVSTDNTTVRVDMEALANDVKLEDWVREDWTRRLTGLADARMRLTGDAAAPETLDLRGVFSLKRGTLQGLPVLEQLAARTKALEFTRLALNTARCDFSYLNGEWRLEKIVVESNGLLRLEGFLAIRGQAIRGILQVGAAPGRLRPIDGAEQRVFTRDENGYKWAVPPMHISGTLDNIQEDLSGRIKDAWIDQQIENVTDIAVQAPEKALETGTKATEAGAKLLEEGIRQAPSLLEQGVRLFDGLLPMPKK